MNQAYWSKIGEMFALLCVAVPCGFVTLERHEQGWAVFHWRTKIKGEYFHNVYAADEQEVLHFGIDVETWARLISERWCREFESACSPGKGRPDTKN